MNYMRWARKIVVFHNNNNNNNNKGDDAGLQISTKEISG